MERTLQSTPVTISQSWEVDGTIVDPGTVTVTITRADGTTLVANAATAGTGATPRTYTLTQAETAQLDNLTFTWVSATRGTLRSLVEITGGYLFSVSQARQAIGDPALSAASITEARVYAEVELERAVGYALVPRYARDTVSAAGTRAPLRLPRWYARAVRAVTVKRPGGSDTILSAADIALLTLDVRTLAGYPWPAGRSNVIVGYEHGRDAPPPGATRAALALAMSYLGVGSTSGVDPRAESIVTVDGTVRLRAADGEFAAPGVNEWVSANRIPMVA